VGIVGRPVGGWLSRLSERATPRSMSAGIAIAASGSLVLAIHPVAPELVALGAAMVGVGGALPFGILFTTAITECCGRA
jgi:MFS family permease